MDVADTTCDDKVSDVAKCHVEDKIKPPMVYVNKDVSYSPETVMANMSEIRNDIQHLKQQYAYLS